MPALDLDRVLQQLTQDFNKFRGSFTQTGTAMQKTFVQAEATVKGLVQSAGGSAVSTFGKSFELVGIQLTRFFLPTIVTASAGLQDFAGWLNSLSGQSRSAATQFATIAAGGALAVGTLRLLGVSVNATTIGFGLLLLSMQKFTGWLDKKIEDKEDARQKAVSKQYTRAEIEGSPEYKLFAALPKGKERARALDEAIRRENQKSQESLEFDLPNRYNKSQERLAKLMAIRSKLTFGVKLPETAQEQKPVPLGGGHGIGGVLGMIFPGLKDLLGEAAKGGGPGAGGGRRPFARDWAVEMQPRFSPVEEARKQFQLQALKSPLEQQLMQDLRQLAQDFNNQKPLEWMKQTAQWLADHLGFK
jgi:hypothetical protein